MSPQELIRPEILSLTAYHVPASDGMVKLDAMENPYGLPPAMQRELAETLSRVDLNRYPDPGARKLRELLARKMGVPAGTELLLGNGSDDLIQIITLALAKPGSVMMYPGLREDFSLDVQAFIKAMDEHQPALIYIAYPNNPTGVLYPEDEIVQVIKACKGLVVLDEAYHVFAQKTFMPRLPEFPNLIIIRTVSKLGLAGIRLGYLAGRPQWIEQLNKVRQVYNVNVLTQAAAIFMLERLEVLEEQAALIRAERDLLKKGLMGLKGLTVFPSAANFFLVRVPDADRTDAALRREGVLVKNLNSASLRNCLRITVGKPDENRILLNALREALG
jgi:histidinol-phosphate aminotransferase